jgi:predicted transcriptional regulator
VRFLQNLKLSSKVTDDLEVSVSYVRKEADDVDAALTRTFSLIEHLGEMTETTAVLIIDEFPSLADLTYGTKNQKIGDSIINLVRTLYEDFLHTKLVISGSYRQTLRNLVARQSAPFYKQLLLREIGPFTESEYGEFLQHYLPEMKFANETARDHLYRITGGIPYNLQLLGSELQFEGVTRLDSGKLSRVLEAVLRKDGDLSFKEFLDDLTPSEVKVLKALARSQEIRPTEIASQEFMDKDTVGYALNLLVNKGIIARKTRGAYTFIDSLFGEWLEVMDAI